MQQKVLKTWRFYAWEAVTTTTHPLPQRMAET